MDGIVNLIKPAGMTSSDAVMVMRRLFATKKVGHTGTLDPDAAGVLPICIGKATRLFDYLVEHDKTYIGEITLGIRTDTQDAAGRILSAEDRVSISRERVESIAARFIGLIEQIPSSYSAIKINGKKAYELARKGEAVPMRARSVRIDGIEVLDQTAENRFLLKVNCSRGTYIRTLVSDIGDKLGCGAYLSFLLRTKSGVFDLNNGFTIEELSRLAELGKLEDVLISPAEAMRGYPKILIRKEYEHRAQSGMGLRKNWLEFEENREASACTVFCGETFYGVAHWDKDEERYRFDAMLWNGVQ